MKSEKISIKWKIFLYLLSFIGILLLLLWVFQTVYLDEFYKIIKKNDLNHAKENILSVIDDENLETAVETIAERYDICVLITDTEGKTLYSAETSTGCSIHRMHQMALRMLYEKAEREGGKLEIQLDELDTIFPLETIPDSEVPQDWNPKSEGMPSSFTGLTSTGTEEAETNIQFSDKKEGENKKFEKLPNMPNANNPESLIMVQTVTNADGDTYAVFLNSVITPVGATVHTLRIQLACISVILVILSLILAFLMSKRVSKPIININASAKKLAKGKFNTEFNGKGYKEISELAETLNHTAKELAKTDVLQKELLANVSHDLRTPLTMITAYSEVMRDIPGENTPENVQVIIDETKRLTCLVNDLLDISKIQAGVTVLETKEFDITDSIQNIIERHSKLLEPYGYQILFEYTEHVILDADEFKLYQVVYNLIANAINYAGEDKKVIVRQIINANKVRIEVQDNGAGIPKDKLENVWERYYKVDKDHKRAILGSGLGLSIVKNILKLHEASYGVESEEGKGSVFWFELTRVMDNS